MQVTHSAGARVTWPAARRRGSHGGRDACLLLLLTPETLLILHLTGSPDGGSDRQMIPRGRGLRHAVVMLGCPPRLCSRISAAWRHNGPFLLLSGISGFARLRTLCERGRSLRCENTVHIFFFPSPSLSLVLFTFNKRVSKIWVIWGVIKKYIFYLFVFAMKKK